MTRQEFITAAKAAAEVCSKTSGLPPLVTVAQAALESRWGQSQLSRKYNNYFGLKAHGRFESTAMPTMEDPDGPGPLPMEKVKQGFAIYASMEECFADRDHGISHWATYSKAYKLAHRGDVNGYVRELAQHWATDPNYAEKIFAVMKELHAS